MLYFFCKSSVFISIFDFKITAYAMAHYRYQQLTKNCKIEIFEKNNIDTFCVKIKIIIKLNQHRANFNRHEKQHLYQKITRICYF